MQQFHIVTDSCANLSDAQIRSYGVSVIPVRYYIGETAYTGFKNGKQTDFKEEYDRLRKKEKITTSLVTKDQCDGVILPLLEQGKDLLILPFSAGLSGTHQSVATACAEYRAQFPEREIIVADTRCASLGLGLLVHYAAERRRQGQTLKEVAAWVEENKLQIAHRFTLDDLFFLKRGGRLSGSGAVLGSLMNIKPLLHMANDGKLYLTGKTRGRRAAIEALAETVRTTGVDMKDQVCFIIHGDCPDDARALKQAIEKKCGTKEFVINPLVPVIAAHSGPGTLAVFFPAEKR